MAATMTVRRFIPALVLAGMLGGTAISQAQLICTIPCPIWDVEALIKNTLIATLMKEANSVLDQQNSKVVKMAKRLAKFTPLGKYVISLDDTPEWRIHCWWPSECPGLFALDFLSSLTYGDRAGAGFNKVTVPRTAPTAALATLSPEAAIYMQRELATLDLADSTITNATDQTGRTRYGSRAEAQANDDLNKDAADESDEQSATAAFEKVSAAQLVSARSKVATLGLFSSVVEQLVVDSKRDRDADTVRMNGTLTILQDKGTTNRRLVDGADRALTTWRQP
jgi:hypothetical protein